MCAAGTGVAGKIDDAVDAAKQLNRLKKQRDALDRLETLKEAQRLRGRGAIYSTEGTAQEAKKLLRDIADDPSLADGL